MRQDILYQMEPAICALHLAVLALFLLILDALHVYLLSILYPIMEHVSFAIYLTVQAALLVTPTVVEHVLTIIPQYLTIQLMELFANSHAQPTAHLAAVRTFVLLAIIIIILTVIMDAVAVPLMPNAFNVVLLNHHNVFQPDALLDSISAQVTVWLAQFIVLPAIQPLSVQA